MAEPYYRLAQPCLLEASNLGPVSNGQPPSNNSIRTIFMPVPHAGTSECTGPFKSTLSGRSVE